MCERKPWSTQEDQMIRKLVETNEKGNSIKKLKWNDIAEKLKHQIVGSKRTGKQCRQRWHNQLNPDIKHSTDWTQEQINTLLIQQRRHGNKWAQIAKHLKGRTDNNVKNYFYSTLRRGVRRINSYIVKARKNKILRKQFNQNVLSKVLAVADGKYQEKLDVKSEKDRMINLAQSIRNGLIKLAQDQIIQDEESILNNSQFKDYLIEQIQEFNRNCKRKKSKRKTQQDQFKEDSQEQSIQDEQSIQQNEYGKNRIRKSTRNGSKMVNQNYNNNNISLRLRKSASKDPLKQEPIPQQNPIKKTTSKKDKQPQLVKKSSSKKQMPRQQPPLTRKASRIQPKKSIQESVAIPQPQLFKTVSYFLNDDIKHKISNNQTQSFTKPTSVEQGKKNFPALNKKQSVQSELDCGIDLGSGLYNMIQSMQFVPLPENRPKDSFREGGLLSRIQSNDHLPLRLRKQSSSFRQYNENNNRIGQQESQNKLLKKMSLRSNNSFLG